MSIELPKKLKNDAIREAVLEIRFEPDPTMVSEVLLGRIADADIWKGYRQARLPTADIPAVIRRANPDLTYQPSIVLTSPDGRVAVRVGPQSVAYSTIGTYPGWDVFGEELTNVVNLLYRVLPDVMSFDI